MKLSATKVCIFFTVLTILLFSCQNDENEETQNIQENLQAGSDLVMAMARMTQYPTSADNIIDGTSCFAVNLPVTVIANGQELFIETGADYALIENVFNISATDEDVVQVQFPVTITHADYTEIIIANEQEWNTAVNCTGNAALGELSCVRFNYPVNINTYDVVNQIADVVVINDNIDMYGFLKDINDNLLVSLAFPVRIINSEGNQIVCRTNTQLLAAINEHTIQCNNDLASNLDDIIVTGSWYVSFYSQSDVDLTGNYLGYSFIFNTNGSLLVNTNASAIAGTWDVYSEALNLKVSIIFEGDDLEEFEQDWIVTEYTAASIELKKTGNDNEGEDVLYLKKE